ncbi:5'-nucleotidase, lipoprotein e(P4) family [Vibrio sp. CAIM 722]|uniref:5'-nucleotidase, lipoprotein e(P4) family n=1 Tax=Vibrio eleionomae TaxID=2653505 RepID=A0A7X4RUT6_9VIBR|nr:5'-nucleotidase, lipoprotein e(P4) family [Vibrio eleionomae]MZI93607.1 5'-nucleotidase, lipoprotein e(P4) family [Vibrio eleionomae]
MKKRHGSFLAVALLIAATSSVQAKDICQEKSYEMALRYQQQSAEIAALRLQTYHFAQQRLATILQGKKDHNKLAVVMDLDETILDNSALLVRDMQNCHDYTSWDTWSDWEINGNPTLIPGAKAFIDYANSQNVNVYYVSDRYNENKKYTMQTLTKLGLPQVKDDHVLLYGLSKQQRRDNISKDHQIIMLMGDSLPDVSAQFKNKKDTHYNRDLVKKNAKHFGADWIVFPNASYGAWTKAKLNAWQEK